ncbi:hypothetical protein [Streptomyces marispadix]|uniref:Uncharacterized protein n=1 Tax=Streptomyces marispadix TaxID=2922868 RepID=A0ABS9SZC4_9ACTN|nr:hypothetical protein [Streptomyces marispadix]MCH6161391.1 hypothetical protein [Streptomyces marispadix]
MHSRTRLRLARHALLHGVRGVMLVVVLAGGRPRLRMAVVHSAAGLMRVN